jgi:hypothetical protein
VDERALMLIGAAISGLSLTALLARV